MRMLLSFVSTPMPSVVFSDSLVPLAVISILLCPPPKLAGPVGGTGWLEGGGADTLDNNMFVGGNDEAAGGNRVGARAGTLDVAVTGFGRMDMRGGGGVKSAHLK